MRSSFQLFLRYRSSSGRHCVACCSEIQSFEKNVVRSVALSRSIPVSAFLSRSLFSFLLPSAKSVFPTLPNETMTERDRSDIDSSFPSMDTVLSMPMRQGTNLPNGSLKHDKTLLEFEVTKLLNSPIGSFGPSTWLQVERLLTHLREREDIHLAFQLLDRVMQEPDASSQSTNDFVILVVQNWLLVYTRQQAKYQRNLSGNGRKRHDNLGIQFQSTGDQRPTLSPLAVWRKVESYQRRGITLEAPVYRRIIQGTTQINSRKPNHPSGPILAETILESMLSQSERSNPLLRPTAFDFAEVILSWVRAASYCPRVAATDAPRRAMEVLNKLRSLYDSGWGSEFLPTNLCFYRVMNIYAHIGDGDTVETLLEELYTLYLDHGEKLHNLRPKIWYFSLVIYAWSRSRDPGAAERAEAVLNRMLEIEANQEIRDFNVSTNCFNITMICWRKLRTIEGTVKVQDLFDRMMRLSLRDQNKKPDRSSYFLLTTSWARHDPFKADRAYRMWKDEQERGNCEIQLDSKLLWTMVEGWYRSSEPCKAVRCDTLIQEAIQCNNPLFQPTTAIFNMAVSAWCKAKTVDGMERAEELLSQMEKCNPRTSPDVSTYLAIVEGWIELGRTERAEEIFTDCCLRIGNTASSAEEEEDEEKEEEVEVFDDTAELASQSTSEYRMGRREKRFKPTKTRVLNCVLKSWLSKAHTDPEAASKAEQLLLSAHTVEVVPNAASFHYVLNAWRRSGEHFNSVNREGPRTTEVLTLLDRNAGLLGGDENLYLKLRRNWNLLSI
jgi:hypothetical protein